MSISVGLSMEMSGLRPGEETQRVSAAVSRFAAEHDLDRDVAVSEDVAGGRVFVESDYPIIVTGFGEWSERIENAARRTVHALAPTAEVSVRWSFDDEDD
ncbi:hypothetical protein [Streptomyces sp. Da 82-17]|uniref:hypothetical protein n=1 Tax=Streptomyces sp. Da 82-17 TaxID=3377116 RepID=UPI0038D3FA14